VKTLPFNNKYKIATYCFTYKGKPITQEQLSNANGNTKIIESILKTLPFS